MRVTSVELHPDRSTEVCVLSFRDPTRQNPYNIKTIGGLDASDGIAPQFYGNSADATKQFYTLSMSKRDVVIRIDFNPQFSLGKSYSDLRDDLYRMIASSRTGLVQVQFINETGVVAAISGFTTKLEATHFDKTPEVQLTISAIDPMLKAPNAVAFTVAGLDLSNFDVQDLVSTAPHGFNFTAAFTAPVASITINDPTDATWSFIVTPSGGFLNGDILNFSSDPKNKQLDITRGGSTVYLGDVITPGSVWPIIFPGDNHFAFTGPTNLHLTALSYFPTYWGI